MVPQTRSELVQTLEASRQEFNAAVEGLSDSEARKQPAPGRWSVLECVEHVGLVEERFFGRLQQAARKDAAPNKQREAELAALVIDRTKRIDAPEPARPTGRYSTLAEALDQFNAARGRLMQFADERAADLYSLSVEHPRFGPLNGAEQLLIAAGHSRRHADQIREVRAALPKT